MAAWLATDVDSHARGFGFDSRGWSSLLVAAILGMKNKPTPPMTMALARFRSKVHLDINKFIC